MKTNKKQDTSLLNKGLIILVGVVLSVYTISILLPFAWALMTSLKSRMDFLTFENVLNLPNLEWSSDEVFKLKNYVQIFTNFEIKVSANYISGTGKVSYSTTCGLPMLLFNTLVYAGGGCIISTLVPCVVAYMCAKYPYKCSKIVYAVAVLIMSIPIVGAYPSELRLLRQLSLYDNFFGNYLQKFNFTGMYFFVFYAFFETLSDSYCEAAEIDGASQLNTLVQIILPLAGKIISTVLLINFITYWDDYQTPLLYLPTKPTIAYGVFQLIRDSSSSKGFDHVPIKIAGCMVLALPILIIFIALKEKLMGNISMGGLKE